MFQGCLISIGQLCSALANQSPGFEDEAVTVDLLGMCLLTDERKENYETKSPRLSVVNILNSKVRRGLAQGWRQVSKGKSLFGPLRSNFLAISQKCSF